MVGDFNAWDGRRHPMRRRLGVGVWELFIPGLEPGSVYKYEMLGAEGERLPLKADPLSFQQEAPPSTASIVKGLPEIAWRDDDWMAGRGAKAESRRRPFPSTRFIWARGAGGRRTRS